MPCKLDPEQILLLILQLIFRIQTVSCYKEFRNYASCYFGRTYGWSGVGQPHVNQGGVPNNALGLWIVCRQPYKEFGYIGKLWHVFIVGLEFRLFSL